ncbi:MAG TPA: 8-oxo-dGTP diphosphatase [Candidatus Butyricicoccus avistercoris]|uniref:8-oxo-dGTP diphosphatase n=1 Tax=Candidatus Butyricicoccus avistercoris TaxID=2838518 RepID=A0A9D1TIG6_9FIRM|nr:8-oxo-dGTP diphosphatase [Candidatus Butyricicoccus avistercoris]
MINTTLCYIEKDNKYLMLHCNKQNLNNDKWLGVGGKFEDKESPEDCVLRETLEETGLTLTSYQYRGIITFVSDKYETEYMHLFTADKWEGEIKECDEGELVWVDKSKISSLPIWEGDKLFFKLLDEKEPFFSLKVCYEGNTLAHAVLNGKPLLLG